MQRWAEMGLEWQASAPHPAFSFRTESEDQLLLSTPIPAQALGWGPSCVLLLIYANHAQCANFHACQSGINLLR